MQIAFVSGGDAACGCLGAFAPANFSGTGQCRSRSLLHDRRPNGRLAWTRQTLCIYLLTKLGDFLMEEGIFTAQAPGK